MKTDEPWAKENVAKRLIWLRSYLGLTQREFAESIDVAATNLNNWEKGRQRLSLDGGLRINRIYGTSLDFLFLGRRSDLSTDMAKALLLADIDNDTSKSSDKPVE